MIRQGMVLLVLLFSMVASASEDWQAELSATLEGRLLVAVISGDRDEVESALESGANPNEVLPGKAPPLVVAIRARHLEIANLLLDRGANADDSANVKEGNTALTHSISAKYHDLAIRLVREGADINMPSQAYLWSTPFESVTLRYLHQESEFRELFYVMLDHGPETNRIHKRSTVLLDAIRNDNIEVMIDLLKAGADPNLKVRGMSALHYAQRGDDIHIKQEMLRELVHYGADIKQAGYLGESRTSAADLFLRMEPPEVYCIVLPEHDTCR